MTTYTIKIADNEADDVVMGRKMFVFRSSSLGIKAGDELIFRVMFRVKPRPHKIEAMKFEVTYASDDAPVEKGFAVIGFRRTA